MLVTIALQVFGQSNSDSILVSKSELKKQIDLNDKHKAQWKYCVETITKADSTALVTRQYIASLDTVIALKDETITLLTLAKQVAIDNRNELKKQLKLQKRKTLIKSIGWGVGGLGVGVTIGAVLMLLKD